MFDVNLTFTGTTYRRKLIGIRIRKRFVCLFWLSLGARCPRIGGKYMISTVVTSVLFIPSALSELGDPLTGILPPCFCP